MTRSFLAALTVGAALANAPAGAQVPAAVDAPRVQGLDLSAGTGMQPVTDRAIFTHFLLDQNEGRFDGRGVDYRWDGQGWSGTDYDKIWIKTEGLLTKKSQLEDSQQTILYSRAVSTYFDLQGGVRVDADSRTSRTWAAFGVQGLAVYFFDLEATVYASDGGHFAARFAASYDLLLTQRLILQPQIEMNLYSKSDPGRLVGSGLSNIEAGLRLRYEISRKFAPYIGVHYEGQFGQTATLLRHEGENPNAVAFVFGVRSWF
ncbi:MAG: copper resistance protein B [Rhodospirillales bacterium]|nr:copper resistance protein B [Rhodospirillales bacterium]